MGLQALAVAVICLACCALTAGQTDIPGFQGFGVTNGWAGPTPAVTNVLGLSNTPTSGMAGLDLATQSTPNPTIQTMAGSPLVDSGTGATTTMSEIRAADPLVGANTLGGSGGTNTGTTNQATDANGFSETLVVSALGSGGIKPIMRAREYVGQTTTADDAALASLRQVDYSDPDMQTMLSQLAQVKAHIINSQNWIVKVREIIKAYQAKIQSVSGSLLTDRATAERLRKVILARHNMLIQRELQVKLAQIQKIEGEKAQQIANAQKQADQFKALTSAITSRMGTMQSEMTSLQA